MAKPNYQFEKRRRENEKQRTKEEKRLRKLADREAKPEGAESSEPTVPPTEENG